MVSAVQSALSGLQAFGTRIQSNANNVANANTDGFKKSRVILASAEPQGVKATVEKVNSPGSSVYQETSEGMELVELSNVDPGAELPEMIINSHAYKANLKTLQAADEMTGELLKITS